MVSGRGELHLSVLIESLRREGYEFEVGQPEVILKEENGLKLEPVEELIIEVPEEHAGTVQMELGLRRAILTEHFVNGNGITKLVYKIPTRCLLGLKGELMTKTRGTAIMNSLVTGYEPLGAPLKQLRNGVIVAYESGLTTPYALQTVEEEGPHLSDRLLRYTPAR